MSKRFLPLIVILAMAALGWWIYSTPPQAQRDRPPQPAGISVDTQTIVAAPYRVMIESYGRIRPRTQSTLLPQVGGEIVWLAADFRAGGFFEKGEELIRLDSRDYAAEVARAEASVMSARQQLAEEQARADQAAADWQRLGHAGQAPPLVLRQPQLASARATLASAEAALAQARLDLERTHIRAPYAGRILEKHVDLGQVVSSNTVLAELYAVDYLEVRLPLQRRDLGFVNLPEEYRFDQSGGTQPRVELISDLIRREVWEGRIVQTEGAIDSSSRQLHVLAQLDDPYGAKAVDRVPLKVGQYVTARIEGREIADAIVIPNRAIYQASYVYRVEQGVLQRQPIRIDWQSESEALIGEGLKPGDELVLTSLGQVVSGTPVEVRSPTDAPPVPEEQPAQPAGGQR